MGKHTPFEGELDHAGNPMCGQSFMAGTLCSLPPGHGGPCGTTCQCCGEDWYDDGCACAQRCEGCGERYDDDNRYCDDCACQRSDDIEWCQLPDGHGGDHDFYTYTFKPDCQESRSASPTEEEVDKAIASIQAVGRITM